MIKDMEEPEADVIERKKVYMLPRTEFKKVIIFDLDETLAHCTYSDEEEAKKRSQVFLEVPKRTGGYSRAGFNLRKGCRECL